MSGAHVSVLAAVVVAIFCAGFKLGAFFERLSIERLSGLNFDPDEIFRGGKK